MADTWQEFIANILGEPKVVINPWGTECDRSWKVHYADIDITIHLYNKPKNKKGSKLMLQGRRQSVLCSYVFEELPKIYKLVRANRPQRIEASSATSRKPNTKPSVKCEQCKFKSTLVQMKMHIKTVHATKPKKAHKRLSNFTPLSKPSKRCKPQKLDTIINCEGIVDNSFLLIDDSFSGKSTPLEMNVQSETYEKDNVVEMKPLLSCGKCEYDCETKENLEAHFNNVHVASDCLNCEFTAGEDTVLKDHQSECANLRKNPLPVMPESNMSTEEIEEEEKEQAVICGVCEFKSEDTMEMKAHELKHIVEVKSCSLCDFTAASQYQLEDHIEHNHAYPCKQCHSQVFQSSELLLRHEQSEHKEEHPSERQLVCKKCKCTFISDDDLTNHTCIKEVGQKTNCDQCDYKGNSVIEFITHLLNTHEKNTEVLECQYCDFKAINLQRYRDHVDTVHIEIAMFAHLASNQNALTQNLEKFKDELANILNVIIEDHNVIKQELFILRQNKHESHEKLNNVEKSISKLTSMVSSGVLKPVTSKPAASETPAKPSPSDSIKATNIPSVAMPMNPPVKAMPMNPPVKARTCFIGDSISSNIDHKILENVMRTEVKTARAYSSIDDPKENEAKESTRFPEKNFSEVIASEMKKSETEILIVQAGSVDITNMKTSGDNVKKYGEYFKQQAITSATNLFTSVTNALLSNHGIQKAIIMKHIPRYDPRSNDPQSVKAALSQLYNDTLVQLWLGSPHKNRIVLGSHRLDCAGGIRTARYRNGNRYDGIHMYWPSGRKAYTESVLSIIREAELIKSPPPNYFRRYHSVSENLTKPDTQERYTCPTQDTDWQNDRDVRKKKNNNLKPKQNTNSAYEYAVPTANRFTSFNHPLNC